MSKFPKPKKRKRKPLHISKIIREEVFKRENGLCALCNQQAVDAHHIIYRSHMGNNTVYNLIALCRKHHEQSHRYQHKYFNIFYDIQKQRYPELNKEMMKR